MTRKLYKDICGGGKGIKSDYDPQLGAATMQAAKTAQQAQNFSQNYYNNVITPLLQQQSQAAITSQGKLNNLYDLNAQQMQQQIGNYNQYGLPATQNFYKMASTYNQPDYQEQQAQLALGDVKQAEGNQATAIAQQQAGLGIDPTSPAAQAAAQSAGVANAAAEAGAMNRARMAAKQLGMQLTEGAANFSNTGVSNIATLGGASQGNATGAFGVANSALGGAASGASVPMAGYGTALQGYNNNTDAWAKLGAANINAQGSMYSGIGSLFGSALGNSSLTGALGNAASKVGTSLASLL